MIKITKKDEAVPVNECFACGEEEDADGRCKCTNTDGK